MSLGQSIIQIARTAMTKLENPIYWMDNAYYWDTVREMVRVQQSVRVQFLLEFLCLAWSPAGTDYTVETAPMGHENMSFYKGYIDEIVNGDTSEEDEMAINLIAKAKSAGLSYETIYLIANSSDEVWEAIQEEHGEYIDTSLPADTADLYIKEEEQDEEVKTSLVFSSLSYGGGEAESESDSDMSEILSIH